MDKNKWFPFVFHFTMTDHIHPSFKTPFLVTVSEDTHGLTYRDLSLFCLSINP